LLDITVVTPTHIGRADHILQRAVNSVMAQTYKPQTHIIRWDLERMGAAWNRHMALMNVLTSWVAFLDSDDEFDENHLEVLVRAAELTGADYVYSWFRVVNGLDPFPSTHFTEPWDDAKPRHTTITTMVRTEIAKCAGFWQPDDSHVDGGEDWRFTLNCVNLGAKIYHVPDKTWRWYHHGGNTSGHPGQGDARVD